MWSSGSFYYSSLETTKLNRLLATPSNYVLWNGAVTQQMNFFKWMRWLYRYSILHRNVINYSHKITNVKKLLSSGFFSSNLTQNNLWASNLMTASTGRETFINTWASLYGDTFTPSNLSFSLNLLNSNSLSVNKLNNLNFYEQSYFFYLHRFDLFSSLPNLTISSNFSQNHSNLKSLSLTRPEQVVSLSSVDFSLRSYTLLNRTFLPYRAKASNQRAWTEVSSPKSPTSGGAELLLLEANKSFLSDSSSIDTLLNLTEVAKVNNSSSPYYTHLLKADSSTTPNLWDCSFVGNNRSKQTPYLFTYSDELFTNDVALRTRLLTTNASQK